MGLFDKWLRPDKQEQKKLKPLDSAWANLFLRNHSEIDNNDAKDETYIKKGYRQNPTVYSIVSTVSKNAGMAKWGVYKKMKDGTKEPYNSLLLSEMLYKPNPLGTWNDLIQQAIGFKMLTGNLYFWGVKGDSELTSGRVQSLYVLPSQEVQIYASKNKKAIVGYGLDYFGRSDDDIIPADEVLHIKDFNPRYNEGGDFLYGQSPLEAAMTSLYTNNDALATSRSYLLNQGPRGILSRKEDPQMYDTMDESQVNAMRRTFKKNHTGTGKAGELLIAPGDWKWNEIGSSAADMMLIEHYKLTLNDICNIYSFPTVLLSSGETTFANQKEAKKALWTNVILPILSEIRDGLNQWLIPMFGKDICLDFDISDIKELQEDVDKQSSAIQKLQGVITINEARAMVGKAPLKEGGDELYIFRQGTEDGNSKDKPEGSQESEQETE